MTVAIEIDGIFTELGDDSFVHAFFSTICMRLENGVWGSRFPILMNELYQGRLEAGRSADALAELNVVKTELGNFPPSAVVWDADALDKRPPWGDNISEEITDLSNYFVTSTGRDLVEAITENLEEASNSNLVVEICEI